MKSGLRVNAFGLSTVGALLITGLLSSVAVFDSPVADAAMRRDVDAVRSLIEQGADVNAAQGDGMTALHWAAELGDLEMANMLIQAGANVKAGTRIGHYTPLHLASKAGSAEVVGALIEAGSDVRVRATNSGARPLHFAARSGSGAAVAALIGAGADPNAREAQWQQTPLIYAASYGRSEAVRALIAGGADPELTSRVVDIRKAAAVDQEAERVLAEVLAEFRGERPLGATEWKPNPDEARAAILAAREVQRTGADVGQYEDEAADDEIPAYPDLVGSMGGLTPLLHAVRGGHTEAVMALLGAGADLNHVSAGDGTSPILMATLNGQFDLALLLVERGADVNLASDAGTTPLYAVINTEWAPRSRYPQPREHEQQSSRYLEVMQALLEAGADPDVRLKKHLWHMEYTFSQLDVDTRGATPFWRAAYGTDVEGMRLLAAYGADPDIPTQKPPFRQTSDSKADVTGLPPIPVGGPGIPPLQAASGAGYGEGRAGNHHRHAPDGWLPSVRYLIEELGVDPNVRDHQGYTALHHGAARGDNELILYLVDRGADVSVIARTGQSTADMANGPVQRIQPFPETVALLERLGSKNHHRCVSC